MKEVKYNNLRMTALFNGDSYLMELDIASGFIDFTVSICIDQADFKVLEKDEERAALLCAALHHPFQLKETALSESDQRHYLDVILHAPNTDVEHFLTEKDHANANGEISNFIKITTGKEQWLMRNGQWFNK